jgi:2-dehydro-3-deoxygalactonokinase
MILAVDSGTTSTRVWVVDGGRVRGGAATTAGARDVARTKSRDLLVQRLRETAEEALTGCASEWSKVEAIVAFGMITSELGLEELPHVDAPVGRRALAAAMVERGALDGLPGPAFLVPGVRTDASGGLDSLDFMRGEETEVMGLLALGELEPPLLYLSTGSHTKFVGIDADGRIEWSLTTLSGEVLWALHRETILADLVDPDGPLTHLELVDEGARVAESLGLSRALFAARLLNRVRGMPPAACSDFVHGALASTDLIALRRALRQRVEGFDRIAIGGSGPLAAAYRHLLAVQERAAEIHAFEQPLGALGAWALYTGREAEVPSGGRARGGS